MSATGVFLKTLQEGVKTNSERRLEERAKGIPDWKMSHFRKFIVFEQSFLQTL
jgi:hypothetical protein